MRLAPTLILFESLDNMGQSRTFRFRGGDKSDLEVMGWQRGKLSMGLRRLHAEAVKAGKRCSMALSKLSNTISGVQKYYE